MPLSMVGLGENAIITGCRARDKTRKFLEGLGLVPGTSVCVLSEAGGNMILRVRGSRTAINRGMAQLLTVENDVCYVGGRHGNRFGRGGKCKCQGL